MDLNDKGKQTCQKGKMPNESAGWKKYLRVRYLLPAVIVLAVIISLTVIFLPPVLNARQLALGEHYLQNGSHEHALAAFDKVLRRDEDCMEARLGKAKSLMGIDLTVAETYLQELVESDPEVPDCHLLLAKVNIMQWDILKALEAISQGEKSVGESTFAELKQEIEDKIAIRFPAQDLQAGDQIAVYLVYKHKIIRSQWTVDNEDAVIEKLSNGSIKLSLPVAGEVKVSAVYGPITRKATFAFAAPKGPNPEADLMQEVPVGEFPKPVSVEKSGFETGMKGWVLDSPVVWEWESLPGQPIAYNNSLVFFDTSAVTAVSMKTGDVLWVRKFPEGYKLSERINDPKGNNLVYNVWGPTGGVEEQINLDTGKIVWTGRPESGSSIINGYEYIFNKDTLTKLSSFDEIIWETTLNIDYCHWACNLGTAQLFDVPDGFIALNDSNGKTLWKSSGNQCYGLLNESTVVISNSDSKEITLIDTVTGKLIGVYPYEDPNTFPFIQEGQLFITDSTGLRKYNPGTGREIWKTDLPGRTYLRSLEGVDTLWCVGGPHDDPELYAINSETGKLLRTYCPAGTYYDIRFRVIKDSKGKSYISLYDHELIGNVTNNFIAVLDAKTGQDVWKIEYEGYYYESNPSNHLILISRSEPREAIYFNLTTGKVDFSSQIPGDPILRVGDSMLFETAGKIFFLSMP